MFGYLITWAGRVLVPDRPWHLAAAILTPVAAIIVLSAWPTIVSQFWRVGLFGAATVAAFAAPLVRHRRVIARLDDVGLPTLIGAFFLLGTSLFPLGFALGLAAKTAAQSIGSIGLSVDALSVALSLLATTILAFSLTLTRQLEGRREIRLPGEPRQRRWGCLHFGNGGGTGTCLALADADFLRCPGRYGRSGVDRPGVPIPLDTRGGDRDRCGRLPDGLSPDRGASPMGLDRHDPNHGSRDFQRCQRRRCSSDSAGLQRVQPSGLHRPGGRTTPGFTVGARSSWRS